MAGFIGSGAGTTTTPFGTPQINKTGNAPNKMYAQGMPTPKLQTTPTNAATGTLPQSTGTPTPPIQPGYGVGFGGVDYNNTNAAGQLAVVNNEAKLKSDPNFVQSELARTNTVIDNRSGQNLDYTAQSAYLKELQGLAPKSTAPLTIPTSNGTPTPPFQGNNPGQLNNDQIRAEAQARIDKQLEAARTAAAGALTGAKDAYDYTNKNTTDDRTLRNAQFAEDNNPFSGKFAYDKTNMLRNDGIADTATNNQYNAQVSQINQKLQDIQTAAPGDQQAMIDQLTKQERDYGIQLGSLTGQINGGQTLAAKTADQNYQLGLSGMSGQLPNGGGQTMQAQNQSFNQNQQTNAVAYQQSRDLIKDKQYQQTFDQNNKQFGLDYALKQATLSNQITNDQAQRAIGYMNANTSQQNANTQASSSANSNANMKQDNLMNIWKATGQAPAGIPGVAEGTPISQAPSSGQNAKSLDSTYVENLQTMTPDKRDSFFKNEKANIIKDLGISGYNQLYSMYYDQYGAPKQ